jgi:hypothetical protein
MNKQAAVESFMRYAARVQRREEVRARMKDRTHVVYRCYNADGVLLYIGQTGDLPNRRSGHKCGSSWWPEVAEFKITRPMTRDAALRYEREAIRAERPEYNIIGTYKRALAEILGTPREYRV